MFLTKSFLYEISIKNAPSGAVINIDSTAIDNTNEPQESPIARGIPPIAAWTVALGKYAKWKIKSIPQAYLIRAF